MSEQVVTKHGSEAAPSTPTIASNVVTARNAAVAIATLGEPSEAMRRDAELLSGLYGLMMNSRREAGAGRFVLCAPVGPGAPVLLDPLERNELKTRVLAQFADKDLDVAWEEGPIAKDFTTYPFSSTGRTESLHVDIDWVSPDRKTVHAIIRAGGEARAAFRRIAATWTGSTWLYRDAKPGTGW